MESETVLTAHPVPHHQLDVDVQQREQRRCRDQDDVGLEEADLERHLDRLSAHHPCAHHRLRHELLQVRSI